MARCSRSNGAKDRDSMRETHSFVSPMCNREVAKLILNRQQPPNRFVPRTRTANFLDKDFLEQFSPRKLAIDKSQSFQFHESVSSICEI